MERNCLALELDKVLEMLAEHTACADAAVLARELQPAGTLRETERRMADTDAAVMLAARFGSPSFGAVKNVNQALRRAQAGASLSMRELLDIVETLRVIRSLSDWRKHCAGVGTALDDRFDMLSPNKYLEDAISSAVLSEDEMADSASPELHTIRRKMRAASSKVREQLDKMIRSTTYQKILQEPVVTLRGGRFVVPVKIEHRGEVPGLVHDTSSSGATVFVEPMAVVEANNELRVLRSREDAEIERILAELSAVAGGFADSIITEYEIVVELDLIFAKSHLAYKMKAVRPKITDDGHIFLKRARHPLLVPEKAVPIDVELGGEFDTLVITGPNTGGKTVTLKTIGLLTVMAMCGLMPPVGDGSSLSFFGQVLVDIGDEQSIEQSLSTFSAHMTNLIAILSRAETGSLVLMDELGAGTDPVEGAALAIAILERLRQRGARVAATTHYAELKAFAINTPGVENGSCEFDVATLRPTYRLMVGLPGRSNAFAISSRLGIDDDIIKRAGELVSGEDRQFENVVSSLEKRRRELERDLESTREARAKAQAVAAVAEKQSAEMERERQRELDRAKADARRILEQARARAEELIDELDTLRKEKDAADFARKTAGAKSSLRNKLRALEDVVDPVDSTKAEKYVMPRALVVGDDVIIADIGNRATVVSVPDATGMVQVLAGIIKTRVHVDNLRLAEKDRAVKLPQQRRAAERNNGVQSRAVRSAKSEVDLRGCMTDEGILQLDRFIDEAIMSGMEQITVIHGKGTGALRAAVQVFLRGHPSVSTFRLGGYGEGGDGVTIVQL